MRIEIVGDGHIFSGTPKQILVQMQSLAFAAQHVSLAEYIDWNIASIERGFSVKLDVRGETVEDRAEAFLGEMIEKGMARNV